MRLGVFARCFSLLVEEDYYSVIAERGAVEEEENQQYEEVVELATTDAALPELEPLSRADDCDQHEPEPISSGRSPASRRYPSPTIIKIEDVTPDGTSSCGQAARTRVRCITPSRVTCEEFRHLTRSWAWHAGERTTRRSSKSSRISGATEIGVRSSCPMPLFGSRKIRGFLLRLPCTESLPIHNFPDSNANASAFFTCSG